MAELEEVKVLVTGGAGFLGSEVVKQLSRHEAQVTVLDDFSSGRMKYVNGLDKVKMVKGDISNEEAIAEVIKNQELVFNLTALPFIPDCYYYPEQFFKVNAMGTVSIMMRAIRSETVERFAHVSSSEACMQETPIPYYHMGKQIPQKDPREKYANISKMWSKLPISIAKRIGPHIRRATGH